ncbi:hypothetical protein Slala03_78890 [Streptomyces lavendulae subsp. lavendulae]|nr:hypothetical protein Slala03_78890 [Streptomyces lavendulae subsp. lavendulae]
MAITSGDQDQRARRQLLDELLPLERAEEKFVEAFEVGAQSVQQDGAEGGVVDRGGRGAVQLAAGGGKQLVGPGPLPGADPPDGSGFLILFAIRPR